MRQRATWCLIVGLAATAGCSRQQTTACEPDERYSTARSVPPVQIPDDLSPPNENDALRLPPVAVADGSATAGECLEAPPSFFGESRPFQVSEDSQEQTESRRSRREARREARRETRSEAPAEQTEAAPAEQRDPEPANDDRVIDN
jgi:hypothetical protein